MEDQSVEATVPQAGLFVQIEEFKESESAIHPMALKKQGDSSKLRDMLTDAETRWLGMTKSTYRVLFIDDRHGQKYALKIFPRGMNHLKAEKDFKHESGMHIQALMVSGGADPFFVLAVEMGCGPLPITLSSGETVQEYNYLLTNRLDKGTLLALLMKANHNNGIGQWFKLSIQLQRLLIKQLCSAVFYLHTGYGLAHLDIKPDNLVFNDANQLALIDLGHTEKIGASIHHATGTAMYRPREVETGATYQVAPADIYSLAMTILVIMIQDLPFGKVDRQTLNRIYTRSGTRESFFRILYGSFRNVDERHPAEVQELLYRCLNPNPADRPSIHEFQECAWIVDAPDTLDANLAHELNHLMGLQTHPKDQ